MGMGNRDSRSLRVSDSESPEAVFDTRVGDPELLARLQ